MRGTLHTSKTMSNTHSSTVKYIIVILMLMLFLAASAGLILWVSFVAMKRVKSATRKVRKENDSNDRESFVNAANSGIVGQVAFGSLEAAFVPSPEGAKEDTAKLSAVRPYQDQDRVSDRYSYHIEISDKTFKALLDRMERRDKETEKERDEKEANDVWTFENVPPHRVPSEVRFLLLDHYEKLINEVANDMRVQETPRLSFSLTVLLMQDAETGIRITEQSASIFDVFRVTCSACFHRNGKSIGHCVQLRASVDTETGSVKTLGTSYMGVLPESVAHKNSISPNSAGLS